MALNEPAEDTGLAAAAPALAAPPTGPSGRGGLPLAAWAGGLALFVLAVLWWQLHG